MKKIEVKAYKYGLGTEVSKKTIKELLVEAGYNDDQIADLKKKKLVMMCPNRYTARVKKDVELYVLEEPNPNHKPDKIVKSKARFEELIVEDPNEKRSRRKTSE